MPSPLGAAPALVTVNLFPQSLVSGPILFDVQLGGARVEGRVLSCDLEYAAADNAIETYVPKRTMAGPTARTLERPVARLHELVRRTYVAALP
jgi:hypothetical protein